MPSSRIMEYQRFFVFTRIQDGSQHPRFSFLESLLRYPFLLHPAPLSGLVKGIGVVEMKVFRAIFVVRVIELRQANIRHPWAEIFCKGLYLAFHYLRNICYRYRIAFY